MGFGVFAIVIFGAITWRQWLKRVLHPVWENMGRTYLFFI